MVIYLVYDELKIFLGTIARKRNMISRFGGYLDIICDFTVFLNIAFYSFYIRFMP